MTFVSPRFTQARSCIHKVRESRQDSIALTDGQSRSPEASLEDMHPSNYRFADEAIYDQRIRFLAELLNSLLSSTASRSLVVIMFLFQLLYLPFFPCRTLHSLFCLSHWPVKPLPIQIIKWRWIVDLKTTVIDITCLKLTIYSNGAWCALVTPDRSIGPFSSSLLR